MIAGLDRDGAVGCHADADSRTGERMLLLPAIGMRQRDAHTVDAGEAQRTGSTTTAAKDDPYAGVGRNAPCPCGSGKKFKMCHGRPGAR